MDESIENTQTKRYPEIKLGSPEAIFIEISNILGVEVGFKPVGESEKVSPVVNASAIFSKLIALMVYTGFAVPSHCDPSYNTVHADVEYWKRQFNAAKPVESEKEEMDGVPQS